MKVQTKRLINIFLILLLLSSCSPKISEDEILASVNDVKISVKDYLRTFETLKPAEFSVKGVEKAKLKNLVIKSLLRRHIILSEADKRKITISEKELIAGMEKHKSGYTSASFEESLLEHMINEDEWKNHIRQNLLIEKMFKASKKKIEKPSMKEALGFYQTNPSLFHQTAKSTALHIVVNDEDLAKNLRKKIKKNPRRFVELARKHSIGPEAKEKARIEIEKDVMPKEINDVLFKSPVGRISPVVKSIYGFHIFIVKKRTKSINKDFAQVKKEIMKHLIFEREKRSMLEFEETLIRSAKIEYHRELIKKL
jgi:foldase protein PrsA